MIVVITRLVRVDSVLSWAHGLISFVGLSGFDGSEGVENAKYARFAHMLSGSRQA